jgi:hypothetical protein
LTGRTGASADLPGAVIARLARRPRRSEDVIGRNRLLIFDGGRRERRDMGNLQPSPEPVHRPQQQ